MVRPLSIFLVAVSMWVGMDMAHAAQETPPTLEEARAAFIQGRALMDAQRWREATEKFVYAARAKNTPGLHYYIAHCLEKQDRLLEALEAYDHVERLLQDEPAPDVAALLDAAMAHLKESLPHLVLQDLPAGASVSLDGGPPQHRDSMFLDPGNHDVLVTARGFEAFRAAFLAKKGSSTVIRVELQPVQPVSSFRAEAQAPRKEVERRSAARQSVFWSSASVGAVGLGVGLVGTGLFIDAASQFREGQKNVEEAAGDSPHACVGPTSALAEPCRDLDRAAKRKRTAGIVLVTGYGAAVLGITGVVLTELLWPHGSTHTSRLSRPVEFSFLPLLGGGAALFRGEF